ncbi:unnamed protein product [Mytilus edulis]|uniref:Uncharacterized protein n=1 Tax=Mytilus edulis TaxID=6550 RepID=A0A8S3T666_MYTED|nr:unnamed protein product [Mytilus edulis]
MSKDIEKLEYAISERLDRITECNNRLKEIALRPDPLNAVQYIDLMIDGEKRENRKGFESRIDALEKCKKRAQYGKSVQIFTDRVQSTKDTLSATVNEEESAPESLLHVLGVIKNLVEILGKKSYMQLRSSYCIWYGNMNIKYKHEVNFILLSHCISFSALVTLCWFYLIV